MVISKLLESSKIVSTYEILDFISSSSVYFIKVIVILKNQTELHIREYFDEENINYSYHWQKKE